MRRVEVAAFAGLALALGTVAWLMLSAPEGEEDWMRFVEKNHCQAVGAADGSNRGGWRCDDGKIHYRWRQQK